MISDLRVNLDPGNGVVHGNNLQIMCARDIHCVSRCPRSTPQLTLNQHLIDISLYFLQTCH